VKPGTAKRATNTRANDSRVTNLDFTILLLPDEVEVRRPTAAGLQRF